MILETPSLSRFLPWNARGYSTVLACWLATALSGRAYRTVVLTAHTKRKDSLPLNSHPLHCSLWRKADKRVFVLAMHAIATTAKNIITTGQQRTQPTHHRTVWLPAAEQSSSAWWWLSWLTCSGSSSSDLQRPGAGCSLVATHVLVVGYRPCLAWWCVLKGYFFHFNLALLAIFFIPPFFFLLAQTSTCTWLSG